jgi:hypothetical protein
MFIERRAEKTFGAIFARDKKRFWDKFFHFFARFAMNCAKHAKENGAFSRRRGVG